MKETIAKISKTKSWLFEKIIEMTNGQPDSSRKTERRLKSLKLEMKKVKLQHKNTKGS